MNNVTLIGALLSLCLAAGGAIVGYSIGTIVWYYIGGFIRFIRKKKRK